MNSEENAAKLINLIKEVSQFEEKEDIIFYKANNWF